MPRSMAAQTLDQELARKCLGVLIAHGEVDPRVEHPPVRLTGQAVEVCYSVAGEGRRDARLATIYGSGTVDIQDGYPI